MISRSGHVNVATGNAADFEAQNSKFNGAVEVSMAKVRMGVGIRAFTDCARQPVWHGVSSPTPVFRRPGFFRFAKVGAEIEEFETAVLMPLYEFPVAARARRYTERRP